MTGLKDNYTILESMIVNDKLVISLIISLVEIQWLAEVLHVVC